MRSKASIDLVAEAIKPGSSEPQLTTSLRVAIVEDHEDGGARSNGAAGVVVEQHLGIPQKRREVGRLAHDLHEGLVEARSAPTDRSATRANRDVRTQRTSNVFVPCLPPPSGECGAEAYFEF